LAASPASASGVATPAPACASFSFGCRSKFPTGVHSINQGNPFVNMAKLEKKNTPMLSPQPPIECLISFHYLKEIGEFGYPMQRLVNLLSIIYLG